MSLHRKCCCGCPDDCVVDEDVTLGCLECRRNPDGSTRGTPCTPSSVEAVFSGLSILACALKPGYGYLSFSASPDLDQSFCMPHVSGCDWLVTVAAPAWAAGIVVSLYSDAACTVLLDGTGFVASEEVGHTNTAVYFLYRTLTINWGSGAAPISRLLFARADATPATGGVCNALTTWFPNHSDTTSDENIAAGGSATTTRCCT